MSMTHDIRVGSRPRRTPALRATAAMMLPALLLLGVACNSGSGGGNPLTELCLEFTPVDAVPAPGTVSARTSEDPGCSLIEVEIVATDVTDVFAFQSVVKYDPTVGVFLGFSVVDSALEADGVDVTVISDEQVFGEITIGVTRVGSEDGINIVGTQTLVKLAFARFGAGGSSGQLELDTPCLVDSAEGPAPKEDVTCFGGTFAVR